jgi:serine/threonine protein phosphatase PrpC
MEATVPLSAAWQTDRGLVRSHNEDFVIVYEPDTPDDHELNGTLYIVADGVGGADAGEVASQYASERALHHYLAYTEIQPLGTRLIEAMQAANTDLRKLAAERDDSRRMATTMVAVAIQDSRAYIGNVGDSRAYRWRRGVLSQLTRDQSLVARLVEEGALTAEEALRYPYKNVILYSLGSEKRPPIDLYEVELEPGDLLLLCSDGLTRHVSDEEIAGIAGRELPDAAVATMVRLARERGGEDNITVALIQHGERLDEQLVVVAEADDEAMTQTIARPRPAPQPVGQPLAARAAVQAPPRMWPLLLVLTATMILLIFILWIFIQQATAI